MAGEGIPSFSTYWIIPLRLPMGTDPASSVVACYGRAHDHEICS